jgi:CRP/FNR family transcriptional regulator, cyclic AMP receptor protein
MRVRFSLLSALPELLALFQRPKAPPRPRPDDSRFFATQFVDRHEDTRLYVPWSRAPELHARPHDRQRGIDAVVRLMALDRGLSRLGDPALRLAAGHMDFVEADAGQRLLRQDEQGDFLLIVLQGTVAEERAQPSGARVRLGEARAGELLGELSVLDGGTRLSACTALTPVTLAVLAQPALDKLLEDEPRLAAALIGWIGKRLSQRLRQTSARLSVLLTRLPAEAGGRAVP